MPRKRLSDVCSNGRWLTTLFLLLVACLLLSVSRGAMAAWIPADDLHIQKCERWVAPAPAGDDANPGTEAQPWATLRYASATVPDAGCTVWVKSGTYSSAVDLKERFSIPTIFRAVTPYAAILTYPGPVIDLDGVRNMVFEGFQIRHTGPGSSKYLAIVDRRDNVWSENVTFRNNIFHDSYNNDLLKIHNGARFITVENNIFYNQGDSEQHMDVNSVTDIVIQDNIFFNDFLGSGRPISENSKHFIVVKDSNEAFDDQIGSERIIIRRNIFLNWQGGEESFVQIGNDGKPYHEADGVRVVSNLMIGNSPDLIGSAFGVTGARDVLFANNTIAGNLPSEAHALRVAIKGQNPPNENIVFVNNIWSDPTGTMGEDLTDDSGKFSRGDPAETNNLILDNNLYWNGGQPVPPGDLVTPTEDDAHAVFADPLLPGQEEAVVLPRWDGSHFCSGSASIREEFVRLVEQYGRLGAGSPAINQANPVFAPTHDILGRQRGASPDLGAYEYRPAARTDRIFTAPGDLFLPWVIDGARSVPTC